MKTYRLTFTFHDKTSTEEHSDLESLMASIAECAKGVRIKAEAFETRTLFEIILATNGSGRDQ